MAANGASETSGADSFLLTQAHSQRQLLAACIVIAFAVYGRVTPLG
jgi:hypothetical protein